MELRQIQGLGEVKDNLGGAEIQVGRWDSVEQRYCIE